ADGPQLLLELARGRGVDRQVPRVVGPGCKLVDEQSAIAGHEELHAQHADAIEPFEHAPSDFRGFAGGLIGNSRRTTREVEDVALMRILDDWKSHDRAIHAPGADDRNLPLEIDEGLQDRLTGVDRPPGFFGLVRGADFELTLAIVTPAGR